MFGLSSLVRKLLNRWSRQQDTALRQMTKRETAGQRIAGFSKSIRVDARFFLLALVPFVPVIISDKVGWTRGALWHAWFWLSVVWAVFLVGIGFVAYLGALRQSLGRK